MDRGHTCRASDCVAPIRAAMRTNIPLLHQLEPAEHTRKREAGCDPFCSSHNIRDNVEMLEREPFAGAAKPGLHFIKNEQDSMLVADLAQALHE